MKEKVIKTYGDLATEVLNCFNMMCESINGMRIATVKEKNKELDILIMKYGENNVIHVVELLNDLHFRACVLAGESNILKNTTFNHPYTRYELISFDIKEINKLKAELEKEIEE